MPRTLKSRDMASGERMLTEHLSGRGSETPELLAGYIARIGRGRLLSHQEEVDLGRRARAQLAEELGVPHERVRQLQHETGQTLKTGGSRSNLSRGSGTTGEPSLPSLAA